jgi:hypothetical protein
MTRPFFIDANVEPILEAWESFARESLSEFDQNQAAARDHPKGILEAITLILGRHKRRSNNPKNRKAMVRDGPGKMGRGNMASHARRRDSV